jgi:hypothetical protein
MGGSLEGKAMNRLADMIPPDACESSSRWLNSLPDGTTPYAAWRKCKRGDWLLWIIARIGVERKLVIEAAGLCAEQALIYIPDDEDRSRKAIEMVRVWCRGEATSDDVRADALTADRAAVHPCDVACVAVDVAHAVVDSCLADCASEVVEHVAASVAAVAASPGDDVAYDVAYDASLARSATLVRSAIPWFVVRDALNVRGSYNKNIDPLDREQRND